MAITATGIETAILTASTFTGPLMPMIAKGLGVALAAWLLDPTKVIVQGTSTGDLGVGVVNGTITLTANPAPYLLAFTANSFLGVHPTTLATIFSTAFSTYLTSFGGYVSTTAVGNGVDASGITTADAPSLAILIQNSLAAEFGASGVLLSSFSTALSVGFSTHLLTAVGVGVVTGTPSGVPTSSPSVGSLV